MRKDQSPRRSRVKFYSESRLMVWLPKQKGDRLDMQLKIQQAGKYALHLTAALGPKSGPISVLLDGKSLGFKVRKAKFDAIDLYAPYHSLLRNFDSQPVRLSEGEHTLTVQFDGQVDSGQEKMVGIDFVWLQKR